jgi:hypothetical protein
MHKEIRAYCTACKREVKLDPVKPNIMRIIGTCKCGMLFRK